MTRKPMTEKQYEVTITSKIKLPHRTKDEVIERHLTVYAKTPAGAKKAVRDSGSGGKIKSVRLAK